MPIAGKLDSRLTTMMDVYTVDIYPHLRITSNINSICRYLVPYSQVHKFKTLTPVMSN